MKEYRFSEINAKKTIKSRAFSRLPLFLIAAIGGLFISIYQDEGGILDVSLFVILAIPILAIALAIGLLIGIKNGTRSLMQNVYRITNDGIERKTSSGKTISIEFDNIDTHKYLKEGLLIKSHNRKIIIPAGLDDFGEISKLILDKIK